MAARLNKIQLAEKAGVARRSLAGYFRSEGAPRPDARGRYDEAEGLAWITKCAASAESGNATPKGSTIERLKERRLQLEIEEKEREALVRAGALVKASEIVPTLEAMFGGLVKNLQGKFEQELPSRYRGRSQAECEQMNAKAVDFVMEQLKQDAAALMPKAG